MSAPAAPDPGSDLLAAYDIAERTVEAYELGLDMREWSVEIRRQGSGWRFDYQLLPDEEGRVPLHSEFTIMVGDDTRVTYLPF